MEGAGEIPCEVQSSDRVADLVRWWSDHRLAGDEEIYRTAIEWRRQYIHLANWWRNQQEQMTLRVREQYRIFAVEVTRKYGILILEDFDLRQLAVTEQKPKDKQKDNQRKTASNYREMVSPSVFRGALLNACRREGLEIRIVPGAYSTRTCHACQTVEKWDQSASVVHRCENCGARWDQDQNAAINLLAIGKAIGKGVKAMARGL
jgi:transposase